MIRKRNHWLILLILIIGFFSGSNRVQAQEAVVHAVLFYSPSCGHCKVVIEEVLPDLDQRYGTQLQIFGVNTYTAIGNQLYANFVTDYEILPENQVVPMLLVGDQFLVGGKQIPDLLPGIVDEGLSTGGIPWPKIEGLQEAMAGDYQAEESEEVTETTEPFSEKPSLRDKFFGDLAGNIVSVIVLVGMVASLVITGQNFIKERGPKTGMPSWIIPVLSLIGIGIAGYLSYVEFNQGRAGCGPVGHCNIVQQSSFATLFGILPVGIAELVGVLMSGSNKIINMLLWGFTLVGTLFSLYLTFLEPFVIGASCLWCLSSAVIMTVLFLITSRKISIQQQI